MGEYMAKSAPTAQVTTAAKSAPKVLSKSKPYFDEDILPETAELFFGVSPRHLTREDKCKIVDIYNMLNPEGDKSEGDIVSELMRLEGKIGAPDSFTPRYVHVWNRLKLNKMMAGGSKNGK